MDLKQPINLKQPNFDINKYLEDTKVILNIYKEMTEEEVYSKLTEVYKDSNLPISDILVGLINYYSKFMSDNIGIDYSMTFSTLSALTIKDVGLHNCKNVLITIFEFIINAINLENYCTEINPKLI